MSFYTVQAGLGYMDQIAPDSMRKNSLYIRII